MKRTEVLPLVVADLEQRVAKGAAEYGEPLTTHNGRDALQDAYEEALDQALYLRQALEERGPLCRCTECGQPGPRRLYVPHSFGRGRSSVTNMVCPVCSPMVDARRQSWRGRAR